MIEDVEKSKSKSYDPLFDLFVTLTASSNKNITNILFLGDSVSSQFFFFMLCDFSYSQRFVVSPLRWMNRSCQFCLSYVDIWLPKYPHNILRLYNRQFNMPCIHDHHPGCLENEKMEQISAIYIHNLLQNLTDFISTTRNFPIFHQSMTLSEQTIVIFNYGLHILSAQIADWSLRGMIRGIFTFLSGQPKNVTFFYRETSSQVFASTYGK